MDPEELRSQPLIETTGVEESDQRKEDCIQGAEKPANISQQVKNRVRITNILVQVLVLAVHDISYDAAG